MTVDERERLEALRTATTVALGPVGIAATVLPATQAYFDLADARDPGMRKALEKLVAKASPAGKVYAARLLSELDPSAGRKAWQRLAKDRTPVSTFSGCIMGQTTLAEYAAGQLAAAESG